MFVIEPAENIKSNIKYKLCCIIVIVLWNRLMMLIFEVLFFQGVIYLQVIKDTDSM